MDGVSSFATRATRMQASEIREPLKLLDQSDIFSFAGGIPDPKLFPVEAIAKAGQAILSDSRHCNIDHRRLAAGAVEASDRESASSFRRAAFYPRRSGRNMSRLSFSLNGPEKIREDIARLAVLIEAGATAPVEDRGPGTGIRPETRFGC